MLRTYVKFYWVDRIIRFNDRCRGLAPDINLSLAQWLQCDRLCFGGYRDLSEDYVFEISVNKPELVWMQYDFDHLFVDFIAMGSELKVKR